MTINLHITQNIHFRRTTGTNSAIASDEHLLCSRKKLPHQVCRVRDNSKLLKKPERFHQDPVLDDSALDNAVDGEHPYLHLLAASGNSQPRALVRASISSCITTRSPSLNICSMLKRRSGKLAIQPATCSLIACGPRGTASTGTPDRS